MKRSGMIEKKAAGERSINPMPRLLTLKDAASYLGLTTWAMRERCWNGDVPVLRFPGGRKIYIDLEDIEAFITKHKRTL